MVAAAAAAAPQGQTETSYAFAQQPRAVSNRQKFRDPAQAQASTGTEERLAVNIMWDRRVVRGNTYAAQVLPATAVPDPVALQMDAEKRKIAELRKRQRVRQQTQKPATPDAVAGRKHMDVQTDTFLEEISDRPVEVDMDTQTDPFMDRPPSPLFIPLKTGVDCETQIYEGDLFDFDFEVEPILQVLVGKTLEQGLMEVLEEEELANMRAHQDEFDQIRAAELAEAQRMEEAERRRYEEKERRLQQERERVNNERSVARKVAAQGFAHRYIGDVVANVFGTLETTGFFYDPLVKEIEDQFLPWLLQGVSSNIQNLQNLEVKFSREKLKHDMWEKQAAERLVGSSIKAAVELQEQRGQEAEALRLKRIQDQADSAAAAERSAADAELAAQESTAAAPDAAAAEGQGETA